MGRPAGAPPASPEPRRMHAKLRKEIERLTDELEPARRSHRDPVKTSALLDQPLDSAKKRRTAVIDETILEPTLLVGITAACLAAWAAGDPPTTATTAPPCPAAPTGEDPQAGSRWPRLSGRSRPRSWPCCTWSGSSTWRRPRSTPSCSTRACTCARCRRCTGCSDATGEVREQGPPRPPTRPV